MALVLTPVPPLGDWLAALDGQLARSASVFQGRAVVLDASALPTMEPGSATLLQDLETRGIRVMAVEGADSSWDMTTVWDRVPMLASSRAEGAGAMTELASDATADEGGDQTTDVPPAESPGPGPSSLLRTGPLRSGQSVVFPAGDVTILGSVASGAEVFAGGSVHVYGTLRGRAVAGFNGNPNARIFCRRLEAELLAIDGLYKTADDMEPALLGRPVQIWLEGDSIMMAALD